MKKRIIPITLINLIIIVSIMTLVAGLTQSIINDLELKDIQNVARLTHGNIFAAVNKEFTEPLNTAIIMSENTAIKSFMNEESKETERKIAEYLQAIQEATGYESVFIVPHQTLSYYHPGGTDAKVDLASDSSFWYRSRINAYEDYSIVVNTEQLDNHEVYVYINANIKDQNGKFAGVTGVGKKITHMQDILYQYAYDQNVEAYIINGAGDILVHQNVALINNANIYDIEEINKTGIVFSESEAVELMSGSSFFVIQHIPMLDWYLVVAKSTSALATQFNEYSIKVYLSLLVAAILMLIGTSMTIRRYKQQIIHLSNIDQLTGIPNRTIFDQTLTKSITNRKVNMTVSLALFDVDDLKLINDRRGHDIGDLVLEKVAKIASDLISAPSLVARIGGDEFGAIIYLPYEDAKALLDEVRIAIMEDEHLKALEATISVGVVEKLRNDTESMIYKRADEVLYKSKNKGKNTVE